MRYIIIGIAIAIIAIPIGLALPIAYDFGDFFIEWWEAFKEFFAYAIAVLGGIAAVICIVVGVIQICV